MAGQSDEGPLGLDDPAAVEGSFEDKKEAFNKAFQQIRHRIDLLTQLPLAHLHQASLDKSMAKWPPMSYIAEPLRTSNAKKRNPRPHILT